MKRSNTLTNVFLSCMKWLAADFWQVKLSASYAMDIPKLRNFNVGGDVMVMHVSCALTQVYVV